MALYGKAALFMMDHLVFKIIETEQDMIQMESTDIVI